MDQGEKQHHHQNSLLTAQSRLTTAIAQVAQAAEGRAVTIYLLIPSGIVELPVIAHARDLSPLSPGDSVVVLLDDKKLEQSTGGWVIHALADKAEVPRLGLECRADGSFLFCAEQGDVRIEANGSMLELRADGRIQVDGDTVHTHANGENRITGRRIALN
ncbi:hypothetical protein LRD18_01980 [Halorhodospira halochloris]|uniref:Gp5/Type VI secretion system Vgr protein OB-fold domain-containing protein n=1 Tax=Halorhodospira halochloris TaxID=1052 RepID=A0A0X8XCV0_HALHR|nr:hypothetical protein [Halorhodospira halochloris]MBK1651721.1 hypothetical protein [Halorhodospira halochloris]MCG5529643.1 hypothetical protein [Halorhodospira halochloris]MCG5548554.1 hypothetical protein [Halorhodospira halochloris]BAU58584.1 hypothetical protein HH1059_18960 [Halorhodospira halochloris]